jgi:DNA end-binding protein Ku
VPREQIDDLYIDRPYYIVPDGKVGEQAYAVIREAIRQKGMAAIGRVVLSTREHVMMLEPRGNGIMGALLRYPYEVRSEKDYFEDIGKVDTPKEMIELASHIIETKKADFKPEAFDDRFEDALRELIKKKEAGQPIQPAKHAEPKPTSNLMEALKASLGRPSERAPARRPATPAARRPRAARGSGRKAG